MVVPLLLPVLRGIVGYDMHLLVIGKWFTMIKWLFWSEKENMKEVDRISILGAPNFCSCFFSDPIPKKYVRAKMGTVSKVISNTRSKKQLKPST